jgi:ectoine hydroxylase-related dioxygenase (phytanoyl-CoA dioxygenase family)
MGSQTATFFHEHTLVKQPGGTTVTPWHHDQPYYCVEGRQNVSLWIPLDPVAEEISLRCIRGSHRWDDEFSPTRFNGSKLYSHSRFKELPDIDAHQEDYDIVSWALEPGMRWPFISARCMGQRAIQPPVRDGSFPPAGWGTMPLSPTAAA